MFEVLLPLALTLIMGSLGLTLTPADFKRVLTAPKGVGIGLANLLLVSPLLAFVIAEAYGLAAGYAVGLVLLGASPGGTTANMLTHLARGEVALSISMTAVSSVASVITVPLFLSLGADWFGADDVSDEISMPGVAARVFLITLVPLSIGMLLRARRTAWTLRWMATARKVALIAFVLVVIAAIISEFGEITDDLGAIFAAVVTLNVAAMTISFLVARAARLDDRQSTAIAMELGVHNTTVALAVAATLPTQLAAPAAVYGIFMFFTAGAFARVMARRNAPSAEALLPVGADVAWPAISTAEGLSAWLAPARLDGDALHLDLGDMGAARARVTACDAPLRFAFSEPGLDTDLRLEPQADGRARLAIAHRGEPDMVRAASASWAPAFEALRAHLEDVAAPAAVDARVPLVDAPA